MRDRSLRIQSRHMKAEASAQTINTARPSMHTNTQTLSSVSHTQQPPTSLQLADSAEVQKTLRTGTQQTWVTINAQFAAKASSYTDGPITAQQPEQGCEAVDFSAVCPYSLRDTYMKSLKIGVSCSRPSPLTFRASMVLSKNARGPMCRGSVWFGHSGLP